MLVPPSPWVKYDEGAYLIHRGQSQYPHHPISWRMLMVHSRGHEIQGFSRAAALPEIGF